MTRILVFGTFDMFHPGHDAFLRQAAAKGDELIVVLARDETVKKVKGRLPQQHETERLARVAEHPDVSEAVFGSLGSDKMAVVMAVHPDIICLGYDQKAFIDDLQSLIKKEHLSTAIIRCESYKPHIYKTSKMRKS